LSDASRYIIGAIIVVVGIVIFFNLFGFNNNVTEQPAPVERVTVSDYLDTLPDFPKNPPLAEGLQAPEFTYAAMDNELIYLPDYIGRKYVVLNFFDTSSPYCQRQLNELQEFYSSFGCLVEFIGITSQPVEEKSVINAFVRQNGIEFPIMHDPSGTISEVYDHFYEPFFVFIGKDGNVINGYTGTIYEFHYAAWDLFNWIGINEVEPNNLKAEADLISGLTISGHCHPGDVDWYVLNGQEGTRCSFTLDFDEDRAIVGMEIYSDESLIGIFEDGRSGQTETFDIPGTCYIKVWNNPDHEGPYDITLEL